MAGTVFEIGTCHIQGQPEEVFYDVPAGGVRAIGTIHLVGCSFKGVRLIGIGIAGSSGEPGKPETNEFKKWRDSCNFYG
jgi:hypothetical protein